MKNNYITFIISLLSIACSVTGLKAQLCVDATVALESDGTLVLDPDRVLNFQLATGQSAFVIPAYFTCDDIGSPTLVALHVVENNDTIYTCHKYVTVVDSTPPVALCKSNLHVQLGENGFYRFSLSDANDSSYDECSEISVKKFIPDRITCTDPNPMDVMMVLRDIAGNLATCTVEVSYDDYSGITDPIGCRDSLTYVVFFDEDNLLEVTPGNLLVPGIHGCPANYSIDLYHEAVLQPDDFITEDDAETVLSAVLTELLGGAQCTTVITVEGVHDPCEIPPFICDTKCHSTPFGDCASGHSDDDAIELPCDIYITNWCALSELYPDAEYIQWLGDPEAQKNAWPTSGFDFITPWNPLGSIFVGYWDEVIDVPTGQHIIRRWTILEWCTQQVLEHVQNIYVSFELTEICDTLPWNAPAGDCQSGHSLSDDVEWPADITVHSIFYHPDGLAGNPEVQFENVRPRVNQDCIVNDVTFHDVLIEINDTTLRVERTWTVKDRTSEEEWAYVQVLTVIHEGLGSIVCVTRESGEPIPDVELIPGANTDNSGCHVFPDPDGIIVTPVKDSPLQAGVNILDKILLLEHLLGIRILSYYQLRAADLNNSAGVSTIDYIEMEKLLKGTFMPTWTHNWRFFEENTLEGSADISDPLVSYKFIGVKMGDIDNSYMLSFDLDDIILRTEDEVLNAGETYTIPFYLERNVNLAGFAVRIINENDNLDFLNVTGPHLPGLDSDAHVIIAPGTVTIQWVSPAQNLLIGVAVDSTQPLFILEIRANENMILNEHLSLEASFDHLLKPAGSDPPLKIRLAWEDVVVSSVIELDNGRQIEFYPNPAHQILHLKGFNANEEGTITIFDPMGRIVFAEKMKASVDISHLNAGMYYITFILDGEKNRGCSPD